MTYWMRASSATWQQRKPRGPTKWSFHSATEKTMLGVPCPSLSSLSHSATLRVSTTNQQLCSSFLLQIHFWKRKLDDWCPLTKTDLGHRRTRLNQWQTWQDGNTCHRGNEAVAAGGAAYCLQDLWAELGSVWLFLKLDGAGMWHGRAGRWLVWHPEGCWHH